MKKLLIIGHARHGKDSVAELLHKHFEYSFQSSSVAASEIFLYDVLKEKYGYQTPLECFEDRVNHRSEWHDLICEYNKTDKARLAKAIMSKSDIYVGMRSNEEIEKCHHQDVFDLVIGVFDPRKPLEPASSFDIDMWSQADIVIPNGGTLQELSERVFLLGHMLENSSEFIVLNH